MKYPTREGLPVPVNQLVQPDHWERRNNHHSCWTKRQMGRLVVTQTLRDLEAYQDLLPINVHKWLHDTYEPPEIDLVAAFDRVVEAHEAGEKLRLGTAREFKLVAITDERIKRIKQEYGRLGLGGVYELGSFQPA